MRRLPADRQLSALVTRGVGLGGPLREVAARLARFHRAAARSPEIDADGSVRAVSRLWQVAVDELRPQVTDTDEQPLLDDVERLAASWFRGRAALYAGRVADGQVCDGHGDLRADNIFCLDDGPRILDCIEFDDHLRHLDVVTDLAFLVMDLRRLGHPDDADTFVAAYEEHAGTRVSRPLLDHGVAYWALVRAKVAHLRAAQGDAEAGAEAVGLLRLAHRHLHDARPRLVLVGGTPGSGKSTLAATAARDHGWVVVTSDLVRKELAGLTATARTGDAFGEGLYDPGHTAATYDALLARAATARARGHRGARRLVGVGGQPGRRRRARRGDLQRAAPGALRGRSRHRPVPARGAGRPGRRPVRCRSGGGPGAGRAGRPVARGHRRRHVRAARRRRGAPRRPPPLTHPSPPTPPPSHPLRLGDASFRGGWGGVGWGTASRLPGVS